jgi:hypothetical protein
MTQHGLSIEERFWRFVDKSGDCWIYKGKSYAGDGYGRFSINENGKTKSFLAHVFAFKLKHELSLGNFVLHNCDNRRCVKDEHLFQGTNQDNMNDMKQKGRQNNWATKGEIDVAMRGVFNPGALFSRLEILNIRNRYKSGNISSRKLGLEYGVSHNTILGIVNKKTYVEVE